LLWRGGKDSGPAAFTEHLALLARDKRLERTMPLDRHREHSGDGTANAPLSRHGECPLPLDWEGDF
jgi:hypothetical protein